MAAHWKRKYAEQVDGVLSVDPVAMSYVLDATGPITVDGLVLTSDNVVDQLLNQTYLRLPEPRLQDAFFRDVARQVFDAVLAGTGSPQRLIEALKRGVDEGRVLVHSFHPAEQAVLGGSTIAGELPSEATDRPQGGVYLNDATGSKMSYYLDYGATVTAASCGDGRQQLSGNFTIGSHPPASASSLPVSITGGAYHGIPAGSQLVAADVYGPVGGSMDGFILDGKKVSVPVMHYQGRPVASLALYFDPGQQLDLTWDMTTGPGQTGDADIRITPGVHSNTAPSVGVGGCRG